VATAEVLTDDDYDQITRDLLESKEIGNANFTLAQFPEINPGDSPVKLVSIENPEHVNALQSDTPLTFQVTGLTIIYGDNASGKSGYARLLKRIARARHQEDILSNVFTDTMLSKPRAVLKVIVGAEDRSLDWPQSTQPELKRMLFYDQACGNAYVTTESDFPYRPAALVVLDGLIRACVAIRSRIDAKLEENAHSKKTVPSVDDDVKQTEIGKYLTTLSAASSLSVLDELLAARDTTGDKLSARKNEEEQLRASDSTKAKQSLIRVAGKLDAIRSHIEHLEAGLGGVAIAFLTEQRASLTTLEQAANLLATTFGSEPLRGIGSALWKQLWDSARRFSVDHAYPLQSFPVVTAGARCVLCEQLLEEEARERFSRFERFIQDDTQTRVRNMQTSWDAKVKSITDLKTTPEALDSNLKDLEAEHPNLIADVRGLISKYESARVSILATLDGAIEGDLPPISSPGMMRHSPGFGF
jgi:hypothetical protein